MPKVFNKIPQPKKIIFLIALLCIIGMLLLFTGMFYSLQTLNHSSEPGAPFAALALITFPLVVVEIAAYTFLVPLITLFTYFWYRSKLGKDKKYPLVLDLASIFLGLLISWLLKTYINEVASSLFPTSNSDLLSLALPYVLISLLFIYLLFALFHFIYSIFAKNPPHRNFRMPLIAFIVSLPILLCLLYVLFLHIQTSQMLSSITLSQIKEQQEGPDLTITAVVSVPRTQDYTIGLPQNPLQPIIPSEHPLYVDNQWSLATPYRYHLTKGSHTMQYIVNGTFCNKSYIFPKQLTFIIGSLTNNGASSNQTKKVVYNIHASHGSCIQ